MLKKETKKTAAILITGASGRLGLELAKTCLEKGYSVIVHYHRSAEPANRILSKTESYSTRVHFLQHDLTDTPEELIKKAIELPVQLEGLVNNASIFNEGNLTDCTHLQSMLAMNAVTPAQLTSEFTKYTKKGWIINITDAHITPLNAHFQNYRISKLLLTELTRQQAFIYAPHFRVNAIAPGAMLPAKGKDVTYFRKLSEKIPLGRTGDTQSLLHAFRFLIENQYITGVVIPVDGGWHLVG